MYLEGGRFVSTRQGAAPKALGTEPGVQKGLVSVIFILLLPGMLHSGCHV